LNVKIHHPGGAKIILLLYLLLIFASASTQPFAFDHVTLEEGLSQSTVFSITQDAEGFLWFGTRDGLNRFDSRHMEVFRNDPDVKTSLSNNTVYSLYTDKRGRLWVGTQHGLDLYNPKIGTFSHFVPNVNNEKTISGRTITSFAEDRHQNLWIGTRQGLNLLPQGVADSVGFLRLVHHDSDANSLIDNDVRSVFIDRHDVLWIGTTEGVSSLHFTSATDFSFASFQLAEPTKYQEKNNWVNAIQELDEDHLLMGTEMHGLKLFDKRTNEFIESPWSNTDLDSKAVRTIVKAPTGSFWIGTIGGLFILNPQTYSVKKLINASEDPFSISDNSIRSMFIDEVGSYWIGTFHGGVNFYSPLAKQFEYVKPGVEGQYQLRFKVASALVTDKAGGMWMGTEGNGLIYTDRERKKTQYFQHDDKDKNSISYDNVKCLWLEEDQGIWVGTIKGLDFYDFRKKQFQHITLRTPSNEIISDDAVYSVMKDKNGNLWVGTYRAGLLQYNPTENTFDRAYTHSEQDLFSLSSNAVTCLLTDSNENIWVGTALGLNKKENGQEHFTRFLPDPSDSTSISGQYIYCIYEDTRGRMWVGTRDHGLSLFNGRSFLNFNTGHGLPGNSVYGLLEDSQGYLWISTENGISKMDTRSFSFNNYDRSDGLICKEYNFNSFHKDGEGKMYFGGYNGMIYFHPNLIRENRVVPALAFTQLKLFNHLVKPGEKKNAILQQHLNYTKELEFHHDQNVFSIEFTVLNYINARKNKFAYKLVGFEEEWNYVEEPEATYMNLQPGHYTLLVKGSNNDGVWNETPLALQLLVFPPPWKTWWAYLIYSFIFFGLLYAWSRLNKRQAQLEHDLQLEHIEKQKQEELHQAKLNFFTNIAHEIRTPLTLMVGPIGQLLNGFKDDAFLKKEIGLVKTNADRLMRLLNQLLDFHKHETGNVKLKIQKRNFVEFIHDTILPFREFAESRRIKLNVIGNELKIPLWFDSDELTKVFNNLLTNAFKFTPGGGEVTVRITKEGTQSNASGEPWVVRVTLEDNGLGIPTHQLEKIFHRFHQAENAGIQEAGFGIGLALTKGIMELHHGDITVESREATHDTAGYTRFSILLKGGHAHFANDQLFVERIPEELGNAGWQDQAPNQSALDSTDKCLILVVEDNDEIRSYICDTLMQHHYDVLEASNGEEGWRMAAEKIPSLILSDVLMNVMNGLDMVTKIKSDVRTSHIPIILLTARAALNYQMEGLMTGADDYLTKPFNAQLLLVKIRNHLAIREKLKERYSKMVTLNPQPEEIEGPDDKFLRKMMHILETSLLDPHFNVSKLASEIGMSRPVLFRKTKMLTGLSVIALIRSVRLKKAKMLLSQQKLTIAEVAFAVGFNDPKYFSKSFHEQFGKSPSQFIDESNGKIQDLELKHQT
jgi:ligand-binding sensor domain-containing protein/signal transduction histidine kinase/AraC-like DNA-binding protein